MNDVRASAPAPDDHVECVVVGAGVVGLAIARALAHAGREVVVLERETSFGTGVSSRNSEVVHAGLHDAPGSLKATLCVRGREMLYAYCAARGVPHRRCGKLLVATQPADLPRLDAVARTAAANGVLDLQPLDAAEASALEPALHCAGALLSPSTGIVDSHALMTALLADAETRGALLAVASPFQRAAREGVRWRVDTGGAEPSTLTCDWLVNAAALDAPRVARAIDGFPAQAVPRQHLAKGHYFSLAGRAPFTRLVYPTPVDGGLGVHLTLDLGGHAKFGPDVEWLPEPADPSDPAAGAVHDHRVDPSRAAAFEADVRRYWPDLPAGALQPAYAGLRPKLSGPGEPRADFRIDGPAVHGVPGTVQLFGIESPGLTASLGIGEHVERLVAKGLAR